MAEVKFPEETRKRLAAMVDEGQADEIERAVLLYQATRRQSYGRVDAVARGDALVAICRAWRDAEFPAAG